VIAQAKSYEQLPLLWEKDPDFLDGGEQILEEIKRALASRPQTVASAPAPPPTVAPSSPKKESNGMPNADVLSSAPVPLPEIQAVV
jgi:tRNA-dihydrouridine synthase 2